MKNQIVIHSPQQANCEALAFQIKQKLGYSCLNKIGNNFKNFEVTKKAEGTLYLIDCIRLNISDIRDRMKQKPIFTDDHCDMALFNIAMDINPDDVELDAFREGFKGVFFENVNISLFLKGLKAIFEGEIWYSRNVLNQFYRKANYNIAVAPMNNIDLTPREKEMLSHLAKGFRNEEIAEKLCVSAHTVKTHIYNLYKKLGVPNRVQAAIWAANQKMIF
jgi:LuxR family transcriptional regulator, positive regulator of biofilm formation